MAKLFVFAMGGTGSRVIKALAFLLASGVKIENADTVIPIIIDPDTANGDLTRTIETLKKYKDIRKEAYSDRMGFFATNLASLDSLGDNAFASNTFTYEIEGVKDKKFKDFIGYDQLDNTNKALVSLLFSQDNLNADMEVGFKGNPNIGSVVLNKFKTAPFFAKFAANFAEGDRVFIISSIFGGTGAAAFPLLVKNIRTAAQPLSNSALLKTAPIGAVTILPYFTVAKNDVTTIDSNTFISKTKAALSYYSRNLSGNGSLNALYYIGDKETNEQAGADGDKEQKNKAHFIEMAAALSIVHFMAFKPDEVAVNTDGKAVTTGYFEFGLKAKISPLTFKELATKTCNVIARPLAQYALFKSFMQDKNHYNALADKNTEAWASNGKNKLSKSGLGSKFRETLEEFNKQYQDWLEEMAHSKIAFSAIDGTKAEKNVYNLVAGYAVKEGLFELKGRGLDNYTGRLAEMEPGFDDLQPPQKLVALFYAVTGKIVTEKIKL